MYTFNPKKDITAYELAEIIWRFAWPTPIGEHEYHWLSEELKRHFYDPSVNLDLKEHTRDESKTIFHHPV